MQSVLRDCVGLDVLQDYQKALRRSTERRQKEKLVCRKKS